MVDVSLHSGAEVDYEVSLAWYLERSAEAGARFEAAVESAMAAIAARPDQYPFIDDHHRFLRLRRFPFYVVYRGDTQSVRVVAIAHARRMTGYWTQRS